MVRMLRISRLFARWESAMEIDYRRLSLCKFAGAFLLTSHWMACLWYLTVEVERITRRAGNTEPLFTWVEHYPFVDETSPAALYIAALYWATVRNCAHAPPRPFCPLASCPSRKASCATRAGGCR